jgi:hypothetical protein
MEVKVNFRLVPRLGTRVADLSPYMEWCELHRVNNACFRHAHFEIQGMFIL